MQTLIQNNRGHHGTVATATDQTNHSSKQGWADSPPETLAREIFEELQADTTIPWTIHSVKYEAIHQYFEITVLDELQGTVTSEVLETVLEKAKELAEPFWVTVSSSNPEIPTY